MLLILGFTETSDDSESTFAQGQRASPEDREKPRGALPSAHTSQRAGDCPEAREALVRGAVRED